MSTNTVQLTSKAVCRKAAHVTLFGRMTILIAVLSAIMPVAFASRAYAACSTSGSVGSLQKQITVVDSGTYKIWVQTSGATVNISAEFDGSTCVSGTSSTAQQWVQLGTATLSAGKHTIKVVSYGNNVSVYGTLITDSKSTCKPTGDGSNCLNESGSPIVNNSGGSSTAPSTPSTSPLTQQIVTTNDANGNTVVTPPTIDSSYADKSDSAQIASGTIIVLDDRLINDPAFLQQVKTIAYLIDGKSFKTISPTDKPIGIKEQNLPAGTYVLSEQITLKDGSVVTKFSRITIASHHTGLKRILLAVLAVVAIAGVTILLVIRKRRHRLIVGSSVLGSSQNYIH